MEPSKDERSSVISNLRACLISSQGGIRMESLTRDYLQVIGEHIPFKRLGYSNLEDFLKSVPEIVVKRKGGDVFIEAKAAESSAHLTKLVARQKKTGKRKSKNNRNAHRYPQNHRAPRFSRKMNKPPLIESPVFSPQKQCYLPLKITLSQNNNVIKNTHEVNDLNNVNKSHAPLQSHTYGQGGTIRNFNVVSQSSTNNVNLHSHNSVDRSSKSTMSNSVISSMSSYDGSSPSPSSSLNTYKSHLNAPSQCQEDIPSYSQVPVPIEEPSKKVKQYAQNRLNNFRKQSKLFVSVSLQHGESSSPYQRQLSAYVQERGWEEPSYTVLKENSRKSVYYCTLKILIPRMAPSLAAEEIECGTLPNDFYDVNEAKECVAKQALEKLKKREIFNTYPIIQDPDLIIQRVERMVKEKETGKWASRIEDEHRTLFKEILPPHWLDVIYASEQFIVEELVNSLLIKTKENSLPFPVPVDSTIPTLVLPEENTWDVYVTRAVSVTEVYLRFIGDDYSGMLDSLTNDMELWYQQKEHLINPLIVVGEYFACYCNESWARVLVLKINIDDIYVKFIDHGDYDTLHRSVLYKLEPKFMSLPAQAISVSLKGLEQYKNCKEGPDYLLSNIVGLCLVAVVEQRTPKISVTLFDTNQEEAINLNEKLKGLFNFNYRLPVKMEEDGVHRVFVTYIEACGVVYVQLHSDTLDLLVTQMECIEEGSYDKYRIKHHNELSTDKIYLLDQNSEKHRVKVTDLRSLNGQVLVRFIDEGGEESVFIEDLYDLEEISYLLSRIPPQAVATRLHEFMPPSFSPELMVRLKDILSGVLLAKVRKVEDGRPIIELFKRTFPENLMASINQTLILDDTLNNVGQKLEQLTLKPGIKAEKSTINNLLQQISNNFPSGSIERKIAENRPVLPDIGEEFQVLVQQTANPSFITFQPLEYVNIIQSLEKDMSDFYNSNTLSSGYKMKEGSLCAVRDKNSWYRAYVDKVIDSESVSVKLLDYGSMSLVLNTYIKPLKEQFLKVPFVGFCCKIHGIAPKHGDWSVDDCLKTRVLINHKKLLAQMKGIQWCQTSLGGTILELQLFDLNSEHGNRKSIGTLLVQEGCAKFEES